MADQDWPWRWQQSHETQKTIGYCIFSYKENLRAIASHNDPALASKLVGDWFQSRNNELGYKPIYTMAIKLMC